MPAPLPNQADIILIREEFVEPKPGCYVLLRYYRHAEDVMRVSIVRYITRAGAVAIASVPREEQWSLVIRNPPANWHSRTPA